MDFRQGESMTFFVYSTCLHCHEVSSQRMTSQAGEGRGGAPRTSHAEFRMRLPFFVNLFFCFVLFFSIWGREREREEKREREEEEANERHEKKKKEGQEDSFTGVPQVPREVSRFSGSCQA